ncbi:MAG: hypothetical protein GEV09_06460, partial [Pseudonocardiaceae bacterium]|nr:hypothetical protein [Pseudonocardiaceae bacterium]
RVVGGEELLDEALGMAQAICRNAPLAVRASRRAIVDGRDRPADERWAIAERAMEELTGTEDYREGPAAFVQKRDPQWTAR